jgi:hypothetical protein
MPDTTKLESYITQQAKLCIHNAEGDLKFPYVTPTAAIKPGGDDDSILPERSRIGHYLQMYDWDACFFSQASSRINARGFGKYVVANFLALQDETGHIPRTISPHRIWDQGDLCKPFLCQTLLAHCEADNFANTNFIIDAVSKLHNYLNYFDKTRLHETGLYRWRNVLESGIDNNLALLTPLEASKDENTDTQCPDHRLLACDLNGYLAAEFAAFSQLAERSGALSAAREYAEKKEKLCQAIETYLWNDELSLYCNFDPVTEQQVGLRSWSGLVPALMEQVSEERRDLVTKNNLLASEHFYRPCGIASMAQSEPLYNQAKRGLYNRAIVSNWQGPMWVLPNVLAVRFLLAQNMQKQAEELALRVINTLVDSLNNTGTLYENYNCETGMPLWAPEFVSWNVLALELIDLVR